MYIQSRRHGFPRPDGQGPELDRHCHKPNRQVRYFPYSHNINLTSRCTLCTSHLDMAACCAAPVSGSSSSRPDVSPGGGDGVVHGLGQRQAERLRQQQGEQTRHDGDSADHQQRDALTVYSLRRTATDRREYTRRPRGFRATLQFTLFKSSYSETESRQRSHQTRNNLPNKGII